MPQLAFGGNKKNRLMLSLLIAPNKYIVAIEGSIVIEEQLSA